MKRFFSYLRRKCAYVLAIVIFAAIFAVVFYLYDIKGAAEATLYASALCLFVLGVFALCGYFSWRRRLLTIRDLQKNAALRLHELPPPRDALEEAYQALIRSLADENAAISRKRDAEYDDLSAYYALWTHQIKSPLAALSLMLTGDDEKTRAIAAQTFRIEQYVEMAMAYLRTDSHSTDFVIRRVDLESCVRASVKKYAPLFLRSRVAVRVEGETALVLSDEKWLCFMIEQILSNAIKYTNPGGCVTIAMRRESVSIADNGVGIAPQDLPRVFDRGFTGENGRLDKRATGVGLYLVSRTARRLGHRVSIESASGVGTTVTIDLKSDPIAGD